VKVGNASYNAVLYELLKPVNGEDNIPVLLEARVVKISGHVGHDQIIGLDIPGDNPVVVMRIECKGAIVPVVQPGR